MIFEQFKQHLVENKNSIYYHLINYTFEKKGCAVYTLNRNNPSNPKNTRSAGQGAHFRVTCWRNQEEAGKAYEYYVYWTKAQSTSDNKMYSDIRGDVINNLPKTCKIVFERTGYYSIPVNKEFVKKCGIIRKGKYCIDQELLDWIPINNNFTAPECFKPEYIPYYTWNHANHCSEILVNVYENGALSKPHKFGSVKDFYDFWGLESKGAKYDTVTNFVKKHQNFILEGSVYIFDESWETVEYKIRKRKIEIVEEVVTKDEIEEVVSSIEKTWEESEGKVTESVTTVYTKEPEYYGELE